MYTLDEYKQIAYEMVANDEERDEKFRRIDAMHNVEWELPREWQEAGWIKKYPSTKPADALDTAIRSLSTKGPDISVMPILPNEETKSQFDMIERGLKWAWKQMGRRQQFNPTRAIVTSAIKYDEITAQLIHVPTHNKSLGELGSKAAREKPQYGAFALINHNPRSVHVQYSDVGFERVVLCKQQPIHKIIDFWGKNANELRKAVEGDSHTALTDLAEVYDYWDGETRCVWVESVTGGIISTILIPTAHELGFIPWVCRTGGTNLEDLTSNQRRPMLNSIVSGDLWNTVNLFRSLMLSLTMARAAEPTKASKTATGDGVDIDATEALGQYKLKQGEELTALPASEVGQSIQGMYQMLGGELTESAGINLLQMNSAPAGMAFATFNAMMQAAMASINPHKQTSELAIVDVFGLMVAWLKHTKTPLITYDDRKKNQSEGISTYGSQEVITSDMLPDLEDFCATVKLTEYVPSDELGKINSMTMLDKLGYPKERIFEALDINDPRIAMEEWANEQLTQATVMEQVKDIQFEADLLRQQKMQAFQMQMQQAQMAAQQQAQGQAMDQNGQPIPNGQPGSQQPMMPPDQSMQSPFEQTQGQGFAGNFGGSSPLAAAPDMTGVGLPAIEGRDNRGLGMPPQGRKAVQ